MPNWATSWMRVATMLSGLYFRLLTIRSFLYGTVMLPKIRGCHFRNFFSFLSGDKKKPPTRKTRHSGGFSPRDGALTRALQC